MLHFFVKLIGGPMSQTEGSCKKQRFAYRKMSCRAHVGIQPHKALTKRIIHTLFTAENTGQLKKMQVKSYAVNAVEGGPRSN